MKEWSRRYQAARRVDPRDVAHRALVTLVDDRTRDLPEEIREVVCQDLFLRIELREVSRLDLIGSAVPVKDSVRAAWKDMPDRFATISLDAPLTEDGTVTLGDLLADDAA